MYFGFPTYCDKLTSLYIKSSSICYDKLTTPYESSPNRYEKRTIPHGFNPSTIPSTGI